jgi:hypothetical protein
MPSLFCLADIYNNGLLWSSMNAKQVLFGRHYKSALLRPSTIANQALFWLTYNIGLRADFLEA